jgi:hypothetical protein
VYSWTAFHPRLYLVELPPYPAWAELPPRWEVSGRFKAGDMLATVGDHGLENLPVDNLHRQTPGGEAIDGLG